MADNQAQRKLRAILSADVKGYSRLMGEDDESTSIKKIPAPELEKPLSQCWLSTI